MHPQLPQEPQLQWGGSSPRATLLVSTPRQKAESKSHPTSRHPSCSCCSFRCLLGWVCEASFLLPQAKSAAGVRGTSGTAEASPLSCPSPPARAGGLIEQNMRSGGHCSWVPVCSMHGLHGPACSSQCSGQSHARVLPSPTVLGLCMSTQGCCTSPPAAPLMPNPLWPHGEGAASSPFLPSADLLLPAWSAP